MREHYFSSMPVRYFELLEEAQQEQLIHQVKEASKPELVRSPALRGKLLLWLGLQLVVLGRKLHRHGVAICTPIVPAAGRAEISQNQVKCNG